MSDPTQGGMPAPTLDAYTPAQLVKIINHGITRYPKGHPQYDQARQIMAQAHDELGRQMAAQNQADYTESHQMGPLAAGTMEFGQAATLGLLGKHSPLPFLQGAIDPQYLEEARGQHPLAAAAGQGLGTGALMTLAAPAVASLGALGGGATLGGAFGAAQGAAEAKPGERGIGATVGGVTGAAGGTLAGVGGKVVGAVGKNLGKVGARLLGKTATGAISKSAGAAAEAVGQAASGEAEQMIGNMPVSELRAQLTRQKFGSATQIEKTIQDMLARQSQGAAPAMPVAPTGSNALSNVQAHLDAVRTAPPAAPKVRPPVPGGQALAPKEDPIPAPFQMSRQIAQEMRDLQAQVGGRALTPEERAGVLQKIMGKFNPSPEHPLYFGDAAPTRSPFSSNWDQSALPLSSRSYLERK